MQETTENSLNQRGDNGWYFACSMHNANTRKEN